MQIAKYEPLPVNVQYIMITPESFCVPVERSDPKGLSTLVSAPSSRLTGDLNSCPPDLELGALTKWLASRC